jgi:polar amino acid transport system permease protein
VRQFVAADKAAASQVTRYLISAALLITIGLVAYHLNWRLITSLHFSVVWEYRDPLARGLLVTLIITAVASIAGFFMGLGLSILARSRFALLRWVIAGYVEFWRNTPLLVQVIWIHLALPLLTTVNTTALQSSLIAITLQAGAYFCEIIRAGVQSVPKSLWDAADALGLRAWTKWTRVVFPPAIKIVIPPLLNLTISLFKATAILSVIQVSEFMSTVTRVSNFAMRPIELFTAAAVIYFVLGYALGKLAEQTERRLAHSER